MATTQLQVTGLPGVPHSFVAKISTFPRPEPTGRFTALSVMGLSGTVRAFSAKTPEISSNRSASDSIRLSIAEDPVNSVSIDSWDSTRVRSTESGSVSKALQVPQTDSVRLRVVETYTLNKSGTTSKTATDTASLSISESATVNDLLYGTDTLSVSVSESASISGTATSRSSTDTISLTLVEGSNVLSSESVPISATDTASVRVTATATVIPSTLYRRVSINLEWPSWKISLRLK